jgi:hypothetical protein
MTNNQNLFDLNQINQNQIDWSQIDWSQIDWNIRNSSYDDDPNSSAIDVVDFLNKQKNICSAKNVTLLIDLHNEAFYMLNLVCEEIKKLQIIYQKDKQNASKQISHIMNLINRSKYKNKKRLLFDRPIWLLCSTDCKSLETVFPKTGSTDCKSLETVFPKTGSTIQTSAKINNTFDHFIPSDVSLIVSGLKHMVEQNDQVDQVNQVDQITQIDQNKTKDLINQMERSIAVKKVEIFDRNQILRKIREIEPDSLIIKKIDHYESDEPTEPQSFDDGLSFVNHTAKYDTYIQSDAQYCTKSIIENENVDLVYLSFLQASIYLIEIECERHQAEIFVLSGRDKM